MTVIEDLLDGGAACVGGDRSLWFPRSAKDGHAAKAVCRGCPVRVACLDYAIARRIRHGIWGGLTDEERRDKKLVAKVRGAA